MPRIYVIEDLCNGCRLCEAFCASLENGVFSDGSGNRGRIKVIRLPDEERDIPMLDCDGTCLRPIRALEGDLTPTCVSVCPTGALFAAEHKAALEKRLEWEAARKAHGLFKVIAPWKWPLHWNPPPPAAGRRPEARET